MSKVIPEMTHPLGKHWDQPDRSRILIDDSHALMTKADFNELADYSWSQPSGVYDGKMWKSTGRDATYLKWYHPAEDPNKCAVGVREILIV